ncbi:MAG: nucleotide exchange factor GrpE [Pseudomonadota bacterium]
MANTDKNEPSTETGEPENGEKETVEQTTTEKPEVTEAVAEDSEAGDDGSEGDEIEAGDPDLAEQLEQANARADENWDRLVRMQAEMDNLRKRQSREIENAHKFALEKIANELLGVRDSLESGLAAAGSDDADVTKLREGSELILKQLTQTMEKFNIVEVNPENQKFDPELHQAMSMQEVPDTEPNTVIAVLQKGYTLNDRLIRPALVMVSK